MHITLVIDSNTFGTGKLTQTRADFAETFDELSVQCEFLYSEITGFTDISLIVRAHRKVSGVK